MTGLLQTVAVAVLLTVDLLRVAPQAPPTSAPPERQVAVLPDLDRRISAMSRVVRRHESTRVRLGRWLRCVHPLPVRQVGDPQHGWGFEYDERDGSGLDTRTALVRHTGPGRPDLVLLRLDRARGCASRAPDPNGTGADARLVLPRAAAQRGPTPTLRRVERRTARLLSRIERLERAFDRFDEWESCLSWLPVTEFGHEHQRLGFRFDAGPGDLRYVSAIDIDDSEWDDPDYELLAFVGRDRPFSGRECGHEPGESVDRRGLPDVNPRPAETRADRIADVRRDLHGAREDLEDLVEPVQEFVQFDECMFTVGVRSAGTAARGYRFRTATGALVRRSALSFDMTGLRLPQMDVLAFPGEEPPQIECNEDAGGQSTDE